MTTAAQRRKVLVLKDEPSIRQLLRFMKQRENGNAPSRNGESSPAKLNRRHFDEIVVDLRCPRRLPRNEVRGIGEIRPSLMGRTLVIIMQVNGPKTLTLIERYLFKGLPQSLLWLLCHR